MADIGNLIINRPGLGYWVDRETSAVKCYLDEVSEFSLETSGETVDVKDALGNIVASFDRSKTATAKGTCAFVNIDLAALQFGGDKEVASAENKLTVPCADIIEIGATSGTVNKTITLTNTPVGVAGAEVKNIYLVGIGNLSTTFEVGEGTDKFQINGAEITLPTGYTFKATDKIFVQYETESDNAVRVVNSGDVFTSAGKYVQQIYLTDPCGEGNTEYFGWIIFPNAKMESEVTISFDDEANHEFSIKAMLDWCSKDKELFEIVVAK
jgi:hypothetical protein